MAKRKSSPRSRGPSRPAGRPQRPRAGPPAGTLRLYGVHPVQAALANPRRRLQRLWATPEVWSRSAGTLEPLVAARAEALAVERAGREVLDGLLPEGTVHQGLILEAAPLDPPDLEVTLAGLAQRSAESRTLVLVLDQVTDPQNVGAVLRAGLAFGAAAAVTTLRNAPPETGALAKAAAGALESLPYIQVTNLARAVDTLKAAGYWTLGLAAEAETALAGADPGARVALVLGGEERGLRRLTREHCDQLVRLPTRAAMVQLNVATAAAVALYELLGRD